MKRYRIFEPADAAGPSDGIVLLKDAFAPLGFLFTFAWLFVHRCWLWGGLVLLATGATAFVDLVPGLGLAGAVWPVLIGLCVGLEGPDLRARKLERRGYREVAALQAANRAEAEIAYYAAADDARFAAGSPAPAAPKASAPWASGSATGGPARPAGPAGRAVRTTPGLFPWKGAAARS